MLTDPIINPDDVSLSCGLFEPAEEKNTQYYTTIYIDSIYICADSLQCKKVPFLGWWPSVLAANVTPLWSHVECQLSSYPKLGWSHPFCSA